MTQKNTIRTGHISCGTSMYYLMPPEIAKKPKSLSFIFEKIKQDIQYKNNTLNEKGHL